MKRLLLVTDRGEIEIDQIFWKNVNLCDPRWRWTDRPARPRPAAVQGSG